MNRWKCALPLAILAATFAALQSVSARDSAPSASSSFPIGTSGSVCEAAGSTLGTARQTIFDRKWTLLCRDIASPVGTAYALRKSQLDLMDAPDTSHPFYWAGFAIVGDGARPMPGR